MRFKQIEDAIDQIKQVRYMCSLTTAGCTKAGGAAGYNEWLHLPVRFQLRVTHCIPALHCSNEDFCTSAAS